MMIKYLRIVLIVFFILNLFSCKKNTFFISDRHGLSYEEVKNVSVELKKNTLILFDYHNDVNFTVKKTTSYNWVGKLIQENIIKKVYWICGFELSPLELNAKKKWLLENSETGLLLDKEKILDAFIIKDYNSFIKEKLKNNYVVTVDFDLFLLSERNEKSDKDKIKAQDFCISVCDWIKKQKPELTTLSLSAVYEPSSSETWDCLYSFLNRMNKVKVLWILKSGDFNEIPESNEDIAGWDKWSENKSEFSRYDNGFYKGAELWINVPERIRKELLLKKINCRPDDLTTFQIINNWKDKSSDF